MHNKLYADKDGILGVYKVSTMVVDYLAPVVARAWADMDYVR